MLSPKATFALAVALRSPDGAPLGDLFSFVSGLYFRGKLTYARRFARPPEPDNPIVGCGIHIITPNAGLRSPDTLRHPRRGAGVRPRRHRRRQRDVPPAARASARALLAEIGPECDVVLLGSIASPKYVDILTGIFGDRLQFPIAFVGRGDMSRGGLLLRHASDGVELDYVPVARRVAAWRAAAEARAARAHCRIAEAVADCERRRPDAFHFLQSCNPAILQ